MGLLDELDQYTPPNDPSTLPEAQALEPWKPEDRTPSGFISTALDYLSRPQYMSAAFFDTLASDGLGAMGDALVKGAQEFVDPKMRLSFSDLIKKHSPEFANEHPYYTAGLGFVGDIALDPTTYLSFGTGGAIESMVRKGLKYSKAGEVAIGSEIAKLGVDAGYHIEQIVQHNIGTVLKDMGLVEDGAEYAKKLGTDIRGVSETLAADFGSDAAEKALNMAKGQESTAKTLLEQAAPQAEMFPTTEPVGIKTAFQPPQVGAVTHPAPAVRELAEKKILDLIDVGRTELMDKGGLKFAGKTIIPGEKFGQIADITGISRGLNYIKNTSTFETLAKAFDHTFQLPQEFKDKIRELHATLDNSADKAMKLVGKMPEIGKESADKIGAMSHVIRDKTMVAEKFAGRDLTNGEAGQIAAEELAKAGLNSEEHAWYMQMRQNLDQIAKTEIEAGLLEKTVKNYQRREYDALKDHPEFLMYKKTENGKLGSWLSSSQKQHFDTLEQARAMGYVPEMNAATLMALRAQSSYKAVARREFDNWVKVAYGDLQEAAKNPAAPWGKAQAKQWKRIAEEIEFIGNSQFPAGLGSAQKELVHIYDNVLRPFKTLATVAKPAFAFKQGVSNSIQMIMEQGRKAFKSFNPLSMRDTVTALLYDADVVGKGTPWAEKIMQGIVSNPLNEKFTIQELLDEAKSLGVISGTNLSGEAMKDSLRKMLKEKNFLQKGISDVSPGLEKVLTGTAKYWNLPGHMEDVGRLSLFINGRKMGYGGKQAAAAVERALFDYRHGLSSFETQIVKRIIPFYSFPRFALPFTARIIATHPGRVQNLGDAARGLFDGWNKFESGDTLTADERRAVPGYLLEQPQAFVDMDEKSRAVFRTFNNFSPLETLGMMETDAQGNIDFKRSMYKFALAQMAPIFKIPIELMVDKNFFTDQAISKEKNMKAGKIGKLDPNLLLGSMAHTLDHYSGGQMGDRQGIMDYLKKIMSWEVTPKGEVFINPTIAHAATSYVPLLNQVFRFANPDKSYGEKFTDLFLGVGTQKVDLKQQTQFAARKHQNEIKDLVSRTRMAFIQGRPDEAELLRLQLQELLKTIGTERAQIDYGNIRGGLTP